MKEGNYINVLVVGYHEVACVLLDELIRHGFEVRGVIPNPARGGQDNSWYRDVRAVASRHSIPIWEYGYLKKNKELFDRIEKERIDIIFSGFSSFIFPEEMLLLPKLGCFNFHNADLPKFRGRAAPIWAIRNGENTIAMTLHWIEKGLDAGAIVDKEYVFLNEGDTIKRVYEKCSYAETKILRRVLPLMKNGDVGGVPQKSIDNSMLYSWDDEKDSYINMKEVAVRELYDYVRSITYPFPCAYVCTRFGNLNLIDVRYEEVECENNSAVGNIVSLNEDEVVLSGKDGMIVLVDVAFEGRHMLPAHWCYLNNLNEGDNILSV